MAHMLEAANGLWLSRQQLLALGGISDLQGKIWMWSSKCSEQESHKSVRKLVELLDGCGKV